MIIGVRAWAIVVGLLTIAASGFGGYLALRTPEPPEPCKDSTIIIGSRYGTKECASREHAMEVYPAGNGYVLVKCICQRGGSVR